MLWNVVYEFFIKHVFGGQINNQSYLTTLGQGYYSNWGSVNLSDVRGFTFETIASGSPVILSMGNYLSLISTIISMVIILVICCALIKKIYNMCAHIIG